MAAIKSRRTAITVLVEEVFGTRTASAGHKHFRLVINEFGIGVSAAKQETMLKRTLHQKLPRVVNGVTAISTGRNRTKVRVIPEGVELLIDKEMLPARADIGSCGDEAAGQRALDVQIPLMGQWIEQMGGDCGNGAEGRQNRLKAQK